MGGSVPRLGPDRRVARMPTHHFLANAVCPLAEPLRTLSEVVCRVQWRAGQYRSEEKRRPGNKEDKPVLSWRASSLSPRSATLVMLSLMIPTVASISCWIAWVLLPLAPLPPVVAAGPGPPPGWFGFEPGMYGSYWSDLQKKLVRGPGQSSSPQY